LRAVIFFAFSARPGTPDFREPADHDPPVQLIGDINPSQIYPTTLGPAIWGLGWQATKNKVKSGALPRPSPLTPGSNREGWTGSQILEHRARMQALAEQNAAADAARPKQEQPPGFKRKVKKTKLRTDQTLKKRSA
jgi:hypothetical protein